jgi:deferrochelatase/peroxidase EfeB
VALGVSEDSLQSFPEAFRVGMAARADQLLDYGANDPKNWEMPFGTGEIHIAVSIFSESEDKWRRAMETARQQYQGFSGVTLLLMQDFGAQPGDLNSLGYRDSIGQPAIQGSGVEPLPGQDRPIKAASSSSAIPGRPVYRYLCHSRTCWDETAPSLGCASTNHESGRSTGSCSSMPGPTRNGSCLRRSSWAAGAVARH